MWHVLSKTVELNFTWTGDDFGAPDTIIGWNVIEIITIVPESDGKQTLLHTLLFLRRLLKQCGVLVVYK